MTGRTLYQFNAGTMTMRTPNVALMAVGIQKLPRDEQLRVVSLPQWKSVTCTFRPVTIL